MSVFIFIGSSSYASILGLKVTTLTAGRTYNRGSIGPISLYSLIMRKLFTANLMAVVLHSISWFLKHPPPSSSSPSSSFSPSRGLVSSLYTPMHLSITLNQPDNSIQRGNWHHLLFVGLVGDWQMIGLVSCVVRAVFHHACMLLTALSVFHNNPSFKQWGECWALSVSTHERKLWPMPAHMLDIYNRH